MYQTADYAKYSAKTKAKLMTELLKNLESFLHYLYLCFVLVKEKIYVSISHFDAFSGIYTLYPTLMFQVFQ